jgi:hypothetical protein
MLLFSIVVPGLRGLHEGGDGSSLVSFAPSSSRLSHSITPGSKGLA